MEDGSAHSEILREVFDGSAIEWSFASTPRPRRLQMAPSCGRAPSGSGHRVPMVIPDGTTMRIRAYRPSTRSIRKAPRIEADRRTLIGVYSPVRKRAWPDPVGTLKWECDASNGPVRSPPAIGKGHRLYAGCGTGFFALGP